MSAPVFRTQRILLTLVLLSAWLAAWPAAALAQRGEGEEDPAYLEAIHRTADMVSDPQAQRLASRYGLEVVNVMWEDTGRYYGSSVGPNISDVTIQVQHLDPETGLYNLTLMPVIRYPNFTDLTADVPLNRFYLLVGNDKGEELHPVNLREYLGNFRSYLSEPDSWVGNENSLLAERDSHVLASAQAAFLPVPKSGEAAFNPVIFNYQSYQENPAVLVIVATREGTSATVIDNVRDAFPAGWSWGQRLFFNQDGERASFTGQRLSDFREIETGLADATPQPPQDEPSPEAAGESGLNMVLLIQVPLKHKEQLRMQFSEGAVAEEAEAAPTASDVEVAVIGHGPVEGPFTEIDGLKIERDERFPVRVTVQFYKATSNGVVSAGDIREIAEQIERVYADADYVGSLVVDGASERPTEYDGPKEQPPGWWEDFWQRLDENIGLTPQKARELLRSLNARARGWFNLPE